MIANYNDCKITRCNLATLQGHSPFASHSVELSAIGCDNRSRRCYHRAMLRVAGCVLSVVVGMVASGACGPRILPVPGKGGPAWHELTSEHFTLWTNTDLAHARELIEKMERIHQVVDGFAFPSPSPNARGLAIAVRDDRELEAAGGEARPYAWHARLPLGQPTIVFSAENSDSRTLTHELTHQIMYTAGVTGPRWLSEGLAMYLESLSLEDSESLAQIGAMPKIRVHALVPVKDVLSWGGLQKLQFEGHLYSTAHVLFAYLVNEHREQMVQFLQLIANQQHDPVPHWGYLWERAFGKTLYLELDNRLRDWVIGGRHEILHFNVGRRSLSVAEVRLSDAEVHAIRAWLFFLADKPDAVRAAVAAALDADPTQPLAQLLYQRYGGAISIAHARLTTETHPNDWHAWWLATTLLSQETDAAEYTEALTTACRLLAQNPALVAPRGLCPAPPTPTSDTIAQ